MMFRCSHHRLVPTVLPGLVLSLGLAACVLPVAEVDEQADEAIGRTEQSLLVSDWSPSQAVSTSAVWFPQVATLAGTTYMVHGGPGNVMSWRQLVGTIWTEPVQISGQSTAQKVSLAPFNGFLYMVRTDLSQTTRLWVSRFTPSTGQWSTSFQIPHTSLGPPALAAFSGRLYLIGVDPGNKQLWSATMTTDEVFSPAAPIAGQFSHSRVSAAVANCKLYIAHRAGATNTIVYNSFDGGWSFDRVIPAGPGGAAIESAEPVIAERSGYLHLLRRDTNPTFTNVPVWWTYFDGTSWASEVSIGAVMMFYPPALTHGGAGLVAITNATAGPTKHMQFTQALPRFPRLCVQPPIGG